MEAKNEKKWVRAPNNFSLFFGGGERQIIKQNFKITLTSCSIIVYVRTFVITHMNNFDTEYGTFHFITARPQICL